MSQPNSEALRAALLAEVPELPAAARANEFAFGKWFFDLAETCRLPSLTLAAEVLVASAGAKDLTAFHPISSVGMLPVHPGQSVILHIKPSRPAYLYVLWVSPKGETLPLFPWEPGDWRTIDPAKHVPCSGLRLPEGKTQVWDIEPERGLETLVVVARAQELKKAALDEIAKIARKRLQPIDVAVPGPFEHDMPTLVENRRGAPARGLNLTNPRTILDPGGEGARVARKDRRKSARLPGSWRVPELSE